MSVGSLDLPYPELLPASRGEIHQAIADNAPAGQQPCAVPPELTPDRTDPAEVDFQEHDRYFQIRRTRLSPGPTFLTALACAGRSVSENAAQHHLSELGKSDFPQLWTGAKRLFEYAGTDPTAATTAATPTADGGADADAPAGASAAADRWLVGHQLFFVLIQGTITGLNCFLRASAAGDSDDARAALSVAAGFMRSSAAAFRFTCDFTPVDYTQLIRPAMTPPAVRAGFSGLQTRDHAHLTAMFAEVRVMRAKLGPAQLGSGFEEFVEATVAAYEAHQLICARFGGDVLPSLRMAARSAGRAAAPGTQVVRQLMRARLFALDSGSRDDGSRPAGPDAGGAQW